MTAQHPFLPRESLLVCADYVTMDSGTGCVHTAPGFGADDYQTCRRYNIDLIRPVDAAAARPRLPASMQACAMTSPTQPFWPT